MFSSVVNAPHAHRPWKTWLAALLMAASMVGRPAPVPAAELLMLEQPGCPWCKRFNEEIAPAYAKTDEGRQAPLRRVDITEDWPEDLDFVRRERLTPTFVLIDDGVEFARLRGYPGDEFFWALLDGMLAKLPSEDMADIDE